MGSRFPNDEGRIKEAVEQELENSAVPYDDEMVEIVIVGGGSGDVGGQPILVTVQYEVSTILGSLVGMNTIPMQSSTEMIIFGYDYQ